MDNSCSEWLTNDGDNTDFAFAWLGERTFLDKSIRFLNLGPMRRLPQEIIARKRDGHQLEREEVDAFVAGVVSGDFKDYQSSALLMAIVLRGMTPRRRAG